MDELRQLAHTAKFKGFYLMAQSLFKDLIVRENNPDDIYHLWQIEKKVVTSELIIETPF